MGINCPEEPGSSWLRSPGGFGAQGKGESILHPRRQPPHRASLYPAAMRNPPKERQSCFAWGRPGRSLAAAAQFPAPSPAGEKRPLSRPPLNHSAGAASAAPSKGSSKWSHKSRSTGPALLAGRGAPAGKGPAGHRSAAPKGQRGPAGGARCQLPPPRRDARSPHRGEMPAPPATARCPLPPAVASAPSSPRRRRRRHSPAGLTASGCGPRRGVQGWVWDAAGAQGRGWGRSQVRAFFPWARRDASPRSAGDARVRREWGHSQRGLGKGQIRVPVVPAADEPGSAGAGLPHRGPGVDVWGMGGSWGFGTGDGSPRLSLQLGCWGEKLEGSSKPHAGKEELTKPRPCPAKTIGHLGQGMASACPGDRVLSGARGRRWFARRSLGDKGMGQCWHRCKPHSPWKKIPAGIIVPSPIHPPQPVTGHGHAHG